MNQQDIQSPNYTDIVHDLPIAKELFFYRNMCYREYTVYWMEQWIFWTLLKLLAIKFFIENKGI